MMVEVDDSKGVWIASEEEGGSVAFALRHGLLERLDKADGHINAAERRLWNETERGMWSARQVMARVAEVWLVLSGELTDLPPTERYLKKDIMHARLQAFVAAPKPLSLESLWHDVELAQETILSTPFPRLSTRLSEAERVELKNGLERKYRFIDALRKLVDLMESYFADRFIAVRPGDWLCIDDRSLANHMLLQGNLRQAKRMQKNGLVGRVLALKGLSVRVFFPTMAEHALEEAIRGYHVACTRIVHGGQREKTFIAEPGYYWLVRANYSLQRARVLLMKARTAKDFSPAREVLFYALDAMTKAWWASFAPGDAPVLWHHRHLQFVHDLEGVAPAKIAKPLCKAMRHIETLSGWCGRQRIGDCHDDVFQKLGIVLEVASTVFGRLEKLISPRVDLAVDDQVLLYYGIPARIAKRCGTRLVLELTRDVTREVRLFRDDLQRISRASEDADCQSEDRGDNVSRPTLADMEEAIAAWEESVRWIEDGWDCIEEYQNDRGPRRRVDELMESLDGDSALTDSLSLRLKRADERFKTVTREEGISIFDCEPKFQYFDEEDISLLPVNEYDPQRYWYYFRWQLDCPYSLRGHDVFSYQKAQYGLDFVNMTENQLLDAVRKEVARWKEMLRQCSTGG